MCDVAAYMMSWPANGNIGEYHDHDGSSTPLTFSIREVRAALSAVSNAMTGVVNAVGPSNRGGAELLEERRRSLDGRAMALSALHVIIPPLNAARVAASDPILELASLEDLLRSLVISGAFKSVQKLLRTSLACGAVSSFLHPNVIASSALRIPMNIHPRAFIPWLCDIVIPNVVVGSKSLRQIHSWALTAADHYDDVHDDAVNGIDASIMLLSVRERLLDFD
jgi:hypothetical protein